MFRLVQGILLSVLMTGVATADLSSGGGPEYPQASHRALHGSEWDKLGGKESSSSSFRVRRYGMPTDAAPISTLQPAPDAPRLQRASTVRGLVTSAPRASGSAPAGFTFQKPGPAWAQHRGTILSQREDGAW